MPRGVGKEAAMNEDWKLLLSFFPRDWRELALRTHALKGLRKDKSAESLLRTLLLHVGCGFSLRETAVRARKAGLADLSDVALLKRLRKCKDWLLALCRSLLAERGLEFGDECFRVRLFDATNVKEPGKTGSQWRIHYSLQVPSLACDYFSVTPVGGEGTGESLLRFPVGAGDYVIADRGYCSSRGIHYVASQGGHVTVRWGSGSIRLLDLRKRGFSLLRRLAKLTRVGDVASWRVLIPEGEGNCVESRLCAIRKSKEAIRIAHKKLKRRASKTGERLQPETLTYAKYVVVLTTFPEGEFSAFDVLEWYRLRWQIELVFKRFKQIASLGHLPKHDGESAKAWLYGKLFVALVTEKLMEHATNISPWGYDLAQLPSAKPMA